MQQVIQQLRPDTKGRINLGKLAEGVSSFHVHQTEDGTIMLEPYSEVPAREKWLFEHPDVLNAVKTGLTQAALGNSISMGSFAEYADEDI